MRHRRPAARLRPPERPAGAHRRCPRARGGQPAGRAVLQLRRPRRRRRRLPAVPRREHALARAQRALRHHRLRPARRRPERRPAIDCKANQETDGIYAQPFTTPFNVDRDALVAKVQRYIKLCQRNERRHPGARLDRERCARHRPDPRAARREQAELLRLLVRHVPRGDVREPLPEELPGDGARRPDRRDGVHQQAVARPGRADRRASSGRGTASSRRARPTRPPAPASAGAIRGTRTTSSSSRRTRTRSRRRTRPTRGRWTATTSTSPPPTSCTRRSSGASSPRRSPRPRPATARSSATSSTAATAATTTGRYGNGLDLYFTIGATEQRYPRDVDFYLDRGDEAWGTFNHDYWNNGYPELNYGLWPSHDRDAFNGPFKLPNSAPTPLVVATTYDPATPYNGALRLVHDLGHARLITMRGDGHTAYGGESACIDAAVEAYLNTLALPAEGTSCTQDTPFQPLAALRQGEGRDARSRTATRSPAACRSVTEAS